jgi:hypothetical protein
LLARAGYGKLDDGVKLWRDDAVPEYIVQNEVDFRTK